jgi:hypothetical protein
MCLKSELAFSNWELVWSISELVWFIWEIVIGNLYEKGRSVGGGGILMQRYNTREAVCHLLSFSIRKNRKNRHLTQRHSVCYKRRKFFQKFPLLSNGMPTWAVRTHDLWSVTRDTWQRKSKNRILSKNQGYRCYIIRSNYKYKSYSIY